MNQRLWTVVLLVLIGLACLFYDLGMRRVQNNCNRDQTGVHRVSDAVK